jgi:RNA polymerase sigma-70 factor, ECF subfamily
MSQTRISLLVRVRNLADSESWREFHAIYQPLIFAYLRGLGLKHDSADDLTQEVFRRLVKTMPSFVLDRRKARFRTFLWRITYSVLIDFIRETEVRGRVEEEWKRRFTAARESESQQMEADWIRMHRKRILETALSRVRERTKPRAWACFEQRLLRNRAAESIAAELGIPANAVYVWASRILKKVRHECEDLEEGLGDGSDFGLR